MKFLALFALLGFVTAALAGKTRYDGYKVFRAIPSTSEQVKILKDLEESSIGVSFWEESNKVGQAADIMLPPHLQGYLVDDLKEQGLQVTEFIADVQRLIDDEVTTDGIQGARLSFTAYHRYSVIQDFLKEQAALHPHARVVNIGTTFEGRELNGIVIAKNANKPIVFIESGIHAREWIAGAVATYVINELLNSPDPVVQKWTEDYEWHIVPISNPDGFEFTHTQTRLWRKTRSTHPTSTCRGADPNRNWAFKWGTGGSSTDPCSDIFMGTSAFSEPETKALSDYINAIADRLVFYFPFHSYSQLVLLPYGVIHPLPEHDQWMEIGTRAKQALAQRYGTQFIVGNIVELLYVASGGSVDWVKGVHDTKLVLEYELRDKGTYGFLLPANQIIPSGLEVMDSLKSLMIDVAALL
jgi:hypothetical protein